MFFFADRYTAVVAIVGSMSAAKRPRSVVNPMVSIEKYREVFDAWLRDTVGTIPALLGKYIVTTLRAVTPNHFVTLVSLLDRLFATGCQNAMILSNTFEARIKLAFAYHP